MDESQSVDNFPSPFRSEVTSADHEKILNINANVEGAKEIIFLPQESPVMASIYGDIVMNPELPNESKMIAFGKAVDLMNNPVYPWQNIDIARQLIDMIRVQDSKSLRIRLASIVSGQLQEIDMQEKRHNTNGKPIPPEEEYYKIKEGRITKLTAFASLASDVSAPEAYRRYAKYLIEGKGLIGLYNQLQRYNTDLIVNPDVEREITEETIYLEPEEDELANDKFIGDLIKLDPPRLPSMEKIFQYRDYAEKMGLPQYLPVNLVRKEGSKFISIEFHPAMTEKLAKLVTRMRELQNIMNPRMQKEARAHIFEEAHALGQEFLDTLNEDQKNEFLNGGNVHVRFSTARNAAQSAGPADEVDKGENAISDISQHSIDQSDSEQAVA